MWRSRKVEEFEVEGVQDKLAAYGVSAPVPIPHDPAVEEELIEKAVTLLAYMPRNQPREKIERLLAPHDATRGRRAVDALLEADLVAQDERGRLRRLS